MIRLSSHMTRQEKDLDAETSPLMARRWQSVARIKHRASTFAFFVNPPRTQLLARVHSHTHTAVAAADPQGPRKSLNQLQEDV